MLRETRQPFRGPCQARGIRGLQGSVRDCPPLQAYQVTCWQPACEEVPAGSTRGRRTSERVRRLYPRRRLRGCLKNRREIRRQRPPKFPGFLIPREGPFPWTLIEDEDSGD